MAGHVDAGWNSPLAWVRARRLAAGGGGSVRPLVMRDTDTDLVSVIVVPSSSPVASVGDLVGRRVGTGAVDSPQATLLPVDLLRQGGLEPGRDVEVRALRRRGGPARRPHRGRAPGGGRPHGGGGRRRLHDRRQSSRLRPGGPPGARGHPHRGHDGPLRPLQHDGDRRRAGRRRAVRRAALCDGLRRPRGAPPVGPRRTDPLGAGTNDGLRAPRAGRRPLRLLRRAGRITAAGYRP